MKAILSRTYPQRYWDVFYNPFWYKNSVVLVRFEGSRQPAGVLTAGEPSRAPAPLHPRDPQVPARYTSRRAGDGGTVAGDPQASDTEVCVIEELAALRAELRRSLRISDLQAAYVRAKTRIPSIEVPHG